MEFISAKKFIDIVKPTWRQEATAFNLFFFDKNPQFRDFICNGCKHKNCFTCNKGKYELTHQTPSRVLVEKSYFGFKNQNNTHLLVKARDLLKATQSSKFFLTLSNNGNKQACWLSTYKNLDEHPQDIVYIPNPEICKKAKMAKPSTLFNPNGKKKLSRRDRKTRKVSKVTTQNKFFFVSTHYNGIPTIAPFKKEMILLL